MDRYYHDPTYLYNQPNEHQPNMWDFVSSEKHTDDQVGQSATGKVFECKTCKKKFPSFQALGGHRASHKKPENPDDAEGSSSGKLRMHECPVCGLEFAVGQALGGHMRRHRVVGGGKREGGKKGFDLNEPAYDEED